MKFIKPSEISGKIMTLFDESEEFVIIVSPYIKISKWYKLHKKFESLQQRNIPFKFIIRDDVENKNSFIELTQLGYQFEAIPHLHAKLYLNERYAIVSSMNLSLSSEINSIEFAYSTETDEEYNEIKDFCRIHLNMDIDRVDNPINSSFNGDWREYVWQELNNKLMTRMSMQQDGGGLKINTGINNYSCFIWNNQQNFLQISGILSGKEYDALSVNPDVIGVIPGIKIETSFGGERHYDTVLATSEMPLKSHNLDYLQENEKSFVAESIINFVVAVDQYKKRLRAR